MMRKSDRLAVRGDLGIADPVDAVDQNMPDGILQAPVAAFGDVANDGHSLAVGGPVSVLHIFEDFARSASAQRNTSHRARTRISAESFRVQANCQLARF